MKHVFVKLTLIFSLFTISCAKSTVQESTAYCPSKIEYPSDFLSFKKERETKVENLANNEIIAAPADQLLSKLISAKSPVVFQWLQKRNLGESNEVEIVKKWRRYYLENFVLGQYSKQSPDTKKLINREINQSLSTYFTKDLKSKFNRLFAEAKLQSQQVIQKYNIEDSLKQKLIKRVQDLDLSWVKQIENSKFKTKPLEVFKWGVAYDPPHHQINIGLEALKYLNEESLFAVFAHEIGHSFDPCRWGAYFSGPSPFKPVLQCLRSNDSVAALPRDDSEMPASIRSGRLTPILAQALKLNPTCNKTSYPPIGVQADQINESFADWFSAEVVGQSNYITKNLRTDLCAHKELMPGTSYPTNEKRLERIYLAHPKISKVLKRDSKAKYCAF